MNMSLCIFLFVPCLSQEFQLCLSNSKYLQLHKFGGEDRGAEDEG